MMRTGLKLPSLPSANTKLKTHRVYARKSFGSLVRCPAKIILRCVCVSKVDSVTYL
jgi:hypothetical protein